MERTYTIKLTPAALQNVQETGCEPLDDLDGLINGTELGTPEKLLAHCLDGAESDREQGWREYVDALARASRIADRDTARFVVEVSS